MPKNFESLKEETNKLYKNLTEKELKDSLNELPRDFCFNDIKNDIFEILYSLVFVVPERFKHIYGFNPTEEIEKSLNNFRIKVVSMLTILDNYGKLGKDKKYLDIHKYSPYEKNKELYLP